MTRWGACRSGEEGCDLTGEVQAGERQDRWEAVGVGGVYTGIRTAVTLGWDTPGTEAGDGQDNYEESDMHRSESEHLEMGDASLKGAPRRRCMLACKSFKSAVLSICIFHITVWLFCQYSWNGCMCLLWISAPRGTAIAVHYLPKKSRQRLAWPWCNTHFCHKCWPCSSCHRQQPLIVFTTCNVNIQQTT